MANLKLTVSLPEELALRFVRTVPSNRRSRYVADLIQAKLQERDRMLTDACDRANDDPETQEIERQFESLPDTMVREADGHPQLSTPR